MKRWLPSITAVVALAGLVWVFIYVKDLHPLGSLERGWRQKEPSRLSISIDKAELVGRSGGHRIWAFKVGSIGLGKDRRLATFRSVKNGRIYRDDRQVASISADEVIYNTMTLDVSIPGKAMIRMVDGPELSLRKLYWNSMKSKMVCEGGAYAVMGKSSFEGKAMTLDLRTKELTLTKVKGRIALE